MTVTITADITRLEAHIPVSSDPPTDLILIDSEQMRIRSHGTDTLLVDRGYNGTFATGHTSGATVSPVEPAMSTTAGVLVDSLVDAETLEIGDVAVTATAAEVNLIHGSVAGTAVASKAAVLGANKNLDTLVIADGGLYLGAGAGTAVSATAAQLNTLASVTAGTGAASKAIVLDANGTWALGTDGSPFATTAARNMIDMRVTSSATSGDTRTLYSKLFLSAAGGGEAGRFYATATASGVAAGGTMNAIHATANIHSGATISGQANGIRATIGTEDAASTPGGTLAAITAETNFYTGSTLPATTYYMRFVSLASTAQPTYVFSFEGLGSSALASAGTGANSAAVSTGGVASKVLKCKVDGTDYWLPLFSSNS